MQILKEEVRERILEVALGQFAAKGYEGASTREIAAAAGISKGNLYNYFPGKEALFDAIVAPFHRDCDAFLSGVIGHVGPETFSAGSITEASAGIARFIGLHRRQFVLLMERSQGTRFARYKGEMIARLRKHFSKNVRREFAKPSLIMGIVAANFLEAMVSIARNAGATAEAEEAVGLFLRYHMVGVAQFY